MKILIAALVLFCIPAPAYAQETIKKKFRMTAR